jgi:flavin-binding protein dodecin
MEPITKTIRLSGGSERSIEDAISTVLGRAALTIKDIHSYEVVRVGGTVSDSGVPATHTVTLDITFGVRESIHG